MNEPTTNRSQIRGGIGNMHEDLIRRSELLSVFNRWERAPYYTEAERRIIKAAIYKTECIPTVDSDMLPCKIGDEVWVNDGYHVVHTRKVTVEEITFKEGSILITGSYKQWLYEEYDQDGVLIKAKNPPEANKWWWESKTRCTWGKSAFATKAEAIAGKRKWGDE